MVNGTRALGFYIGCSGAFKDNLKNLSWNAITNVMNHQFDTQTLALQVNVYVGCNGKIDFFSCKKFSTRYAIIYGINHQDMPIKTFTKS
jgi:hypothetical protein